LQVSSRAALIRLLQDLAQEDIITLDAASVAESGSFSNLDSNPSNGGRVPFPAPVLNKFTDMQMLLLIDPIHDVSQKGWPQLKPTETPNQ
jgi:hypothetical protein